MNVVDTYLKHTIAKQLRAWIKDDQVKCLNCKL